MRLPAMLSMVVRRATPSPAAHVRPKSPAEIVRGLKSELSVVDERMAMSRTCPHAYGRRRVMEEVTASVAAEAKMSGRSGLDSWRSLVRISWLMRCDDCVVTAAALLNSISLS